VTDHVCQPFADRDGTIIGTVLMAPDVSDETRRVLAGLIEAARRVHAERVAADPSIVERFEAGQERIRERAAQEPAS
jgi:hypothetical protein